MASRGFEPSMGTWPMTSFRRSLAGPRKPAKKGRTKQQPATAAMKQTPKPIPKRTTMGSMPEEAVCKAAVTNMPAAAAAPTPVEEVRSGR